jgi:hypothetical protein
MKKIAAILFLSGLLSIGGVSQKKNIIPRKQQVAFFQEEITLTVTDSIARVEGVYHFRNYTDHDFTMPVVFPFYIDSTTQFPDMIRPFLVDSLNQKHPIPFSEVRKAGIIRMGIPLEAGRERTWYLNYEQKISAKRAVYIITTTAAWKNPLVKATYTFVTPKNFQVVSAWPEPDTTFEKDNYIYRQCVKHDFMPDRDMEIIWK